MNPVVQGDDFITPPVLPAKRGRGRPRKDPNLKRVKTARGPPGFEGAKVDHPHKVDRVEGNDNMVGQAVTGVVEATFDAGYMLSVRIGNSNATLRGVVFKPGHYVPVTAENDIAPHVQMIRRSNTHFPAQNRTWSRAHKLAIQAAGATVGPKRKYTSPNIVSSVPPVGVRGTVVPVVLQPVNPSSGLPTSGATSGPMPSEAQSASPLLLEDKDVETVEPLSMLPPAQSLPAGQIPIPIQPQFGPQESMQNENASSQENTPDVEKGEGTESIELQMAGSSRLSEDDNKNGNDAWEPSTEDYGVNGSFSTLPSQTPLVSTPLYNYGTGRMTELLQALQENMKEIPLPVPERPTSASSASQVEFHEAKSAENDAKQ